MKSDELVILGIAALAVMMIMKPSKAQAKTVSQPGYYDAPNNGAVWTGYSDSGASERVFSI